MKLTFLLITLLIATCGLIARTQQPSPLSPEASKTYLQLDAQEKELTRQLNEVRGYKLAILIGANINPEARGNCQADDKGIVSCQKPQPSPKP